ncbi:MAG: hypothetical protein HY739_15670 [Desulfobacterales bacterium]|nr:hypothetical protein [Desulfobacterales bacterium]
MSEIKPFHTNKKNYTLLLISVLSVFFFSISYAARYCIAEDKSEIKGNLFPIHTQSSQVITEV